jgi:2-polyprenyl-6-methoxyphenol hydroxylase-like FAD-dependent oxidoreductase
MAHIAVIGGGIAGLASGLALGRRGHEVTILERDAAAPPSDTSDAFEHWHRPGVPQERQSHAFLARLRLLLQEEAPDLLDELFAAGTTEIRFMDFKPPTLADHDPRPGDDDLVALACRRPVFESVLRRHVERLASVRIVSGAEVTGLSSVAAGLSAPVVTAVRATGEGVEQTFEADVVIDASGRQSAAPTWLHDIEARPLTESASECGMSYYTRFYRLRPGAEAPPFGSFSTDAGYLRFGLFPADGPHFSITFALPAGDPDLGSLRKPDAFDAAASLYPATAAWVDPTRAEPTTDVLLMAGLWNRLRRLVVDGEPVVLGFHLVGDSAMHTNPAYGRGVSLAFVQAFAVAAIVDEHASDHHRAALAVDAFVGTDLEPWYQAAATQDPDMVAGWRRHAAGQPAADDDGSPAAFFTYGLAPASRQDPEVFRAFLRVFNLLDQPSALMARPDIVERILAVYNDPDRRHVELAGPTRDELLAALAAAGDPVPG